MPLLLAATAVTAATGIGKAILGSNAANAAAKAQQQASQQNLAQQQQIYDTATGNLQPFVGYGQNAGNALQGLLGIGGNPAASQQAFDTFRNSTNYQFLLNQGLQGTAYANAPNLFSGATGKALNNYAQGMAGNALGNYENLLQNQSQLGIGAASNLGQIGLGIAGQGAQARNLAAGATGSAALQNAANWGSALQGVGNLIGQSSFQNPFGGGFNPSASALAPFQPNPGLDTAWNSAVGGGR
jgi:hypothetical protein